VYDDVCWAPARPLVSLVVVALLLCLVLVAMLAGSPTDLNPLPGDPLTTGGFFL
jgi:hypothetical protein